MRNVKMNGIYIDHTDVKVVPEYIGVKNKINGQLKAFKNLNVNIDYITVFNNEITVNNTRTNMFIRRFKGQFIIGDLFYLSLMNLNLDFSKYDFAYIRFNVGNYTLIKLIKHLYNRGIKVFLEVPTYPYKDEYTKTFRNKIMLENDKLVWRFIRKYVYKVVTTNNLNVINNIETIKIFNAVDLESIKIKEASDYNSDINLVAVANINKWHGYDRLIKGLANYYNKSPKRIINFHIVGLGKERDNLIELTNKLNLDKRVIFHGLKTGEELDCIFEKCHIGVSSLALFRAGGGHDPIKAREYVAKGLPVIVGYKDRALSNKLPFVFDVSEDESDINLNEIIHKYDNLNISTKQIRKYAEKNLSWESQILKIVEKI